MVRETREHLRDVLGEALHLDMATLVVAEHLVVLEWRQERNLYDLSEGKVVLLPYCLVPCCPRVEREGDAGEEGGATTILFRPIQSF